MYQKTKIQSTYTSGQCVKQQIRNFSCNSGSGFYISFLYFFCHWCNDIQMVLFTWNFAPMDHFICHIGNLWIILVISLPIQEWIKGISVIITCLLVNELSSCRRNRKPLHSSSLLFKTTTVLKGEQMFFKEYTWRWQWVEIVLL